MTPTVKTIVRAAQQEFKNAAAEEARRDGNELAYPEEVDVDTINRACSGEQSDCFVTIKLSVTFVLRCN